MSAWPPPPDLESIQNLVRAADPEGHIAEGAAPDEYEPEEEAIYAFIAKWPINQITVPNLVPIIERSRNSFAYDYWSPVIAGPALALPNNARFFGLKQTLSAIGAFR